MKKRTIAVAIVAIVVLYFAAAFVIRANLLKKYEEAKDLFEQKQYEEALERFDELGPSYRDVAQYIEETNLGIEEKKVAAEKQARYDAAKSLLDNGQYVEAESAFLAISEFLNSKEMACEAVYQYAVKLLENSQYNTAAQEFRRISDYKDSSEKESECRYLYAVELYTNGEYEEASPIFQELGNYKESALYNAKIALNIYEAQQAIVYDEATKLYHEGKYQQAAKEFEVLDDYLDSKELLQKCNDAIKRQKLANTISAGVRHSVGIIENGGKAVSTGYDSFGRSNVSSWENLVSVSAGGEITIGLTEDGTAVAAHRRSDIDLEGWRDLIAVSAGNQYILGLKNDGTVVSQGHDLGDGQRKVDHWKNIVAIATGWRHSVGLDSAGNVLIAGYKDESQSTAIRNANKPEDKWVDIVAIAAGGGCDGGHGDGHTVGLRKDGRVCAVGDNEYNQCEVSEWENVVAIAAGDWHTVALCADGTVLSTKPDPDKFPDLYLAACEVESWKSENVVAITAGTGTTLGLRADGTVIARGFNDFGQTGNTDTWDKIRIITSHS